MSNGIAGATIDGMKLMVTFMQWLIPNLCFLLFVAAECLLIYGIFKFFGAI